MPTLRAMPVVFWVVLGLAGLMCCACFPNALADQFVEGGNVENLSALLLLSSALALVLHYPAGTHLHLGVIAFLLAEREFDTGFLRDGHGVRLVLDWIEATLLHNLLFAAALGLWLVIELWRKSLPALRAALRADAMIPMVLLIGIGFAVLGQIAGESAKFLSAQLSETAYVQLMIIEELSELYFSIGIFAAVLVGWSKPKTIMNARSQKAR